MTSPSRKIFLLSCCLWCSAQAADIVLAANSSESPCDQCSVIAKDLDFLRAEPSRKQKQSIESDGITTKGDAAILEAAVVDVLRFCSGLSLWHFPGNYEKVLSRTTKYGARVLQWPPKFGANKTVPLSPMRYSGWKIVSGSELSVQFEFGDMAPNGGLKWPPIVSWRMVFAREDGRWKFDRYDS